MPYDNKAVLIGCISKLRQSLFCRNGWNRFLHKFIPGHDSPIYQTTSFKIVECMTGRTGFLEFYNTYFLNNTGRSIDVEYFFFYAAKG